MNVAALTISVIAIGIALLLAWHAFDGNRNGRR
jgi:hypothetical protein